ncbi:redoxin domain-containing protein [Paludisphaera rhizosphaerae]|uniref:redoxin domain-containing protein n=1 Tax=Paludisphaera rhizosphaerae TaxID=2711216 RepID=UPI0013EC6A76|nr:redoxin domain-containing protein [Paludisphaera rhizosphaerae]
MIAAGLIGVVLAGLAASGETTADFRLQDYRGAWHTLDEARDRKVVVVAFLGVECPLADTYAPILAEAARDFEKRGVGFFGVDANQQDGPVAIGRFAEKHKLPFPVLKDVGNELADRLGAERTPEVFVLNESRAVVYRGRIDDQYAIGVHRPTPTRRDLVDAVEAALAGRPVATPRTDVVGCLIGRVSKPSAGATVTYAKQVSRILQSRCVSCHRPGEIGPFSLTEYRQAAGWSSMIAEVVDEGRMPPWHASPEHGKFANDARLTAEEKQAIRDWVAAGSPEGDPADLPPPATFVEGWRIPKPDLVLEMPREVEIPAEGSMPYELVEIDPKLSHDVWVRASQVRPRNTSVVHHVVAYVMPPGVSKIDEEGGDFLAAYAPGMPPRILADGMAKRIPAGSRIMLQLHYTTRGTKQVDRSGIGLVFADPTTVRKELMSGMALDFRFQIPPGTRDYVSRGEFRFSQPSMLISLMPHMHLRGKSMRFVVDYPDGRRETVLDVPRYEFDWQNLYVLAEPKPMPEGTILRTEAHFDNSDENPNNPDPKRAVTFGEQTWDEMHIGYLNFVLADQDLTLGAPVSKKLENGRYEVTFRHHPEGPAKSVALVGTFTDWKNRPLAMTGPDAQGNYSTTIPLEAGSHEYKFLIDGQTFRHDPGNPNSAGFFHNSLIRLP